MLTYLDIYNFVRLYLILHEFSFLIDLELKAFVFAVER